MKQLLIILALSTCASAQTFLGQNGDCTLGGQSDVTQGLAAAGVAPIGTTSISAGSGVMGSFPGCQVFVAPTGSTTAAQLYGSNNISDTISNPFTANTDGTWLFYAASACYDITLSTSGTITLPTSRTYTDVCVGAGGLTGLTINVAGLVMPGHPVYWSADPSQQASCSALITPGLSILCLQPDGNWAMSNNGGAFADLNTSTTVMKRGDGGSDYTTASATFVDVDATNLAYTVSIPLNWKMVISFTLTGRNDTITDSIQVCIADGTTTLASVTNTAAAANNYNSIAMQYMFTGDGASHTFKLRYAASAGGTARILNNTTTAQATMIFSLSSN